MLWGSNARETHPIFFHHVLKAVRKGARLYVVDPRRTSSAEWAEGWLPVEVGTDVALANGVAHVILDEGLEHKEFIGRATENFAAYRELVARYDLERTAKLTGVAPELIQKLARDYAKADKAMICWTLGITEHHNAVDNVLSLINLGLLTGHVGRWGSGLNPLRGQNNVQGGGDSGALPHKLPGFQDVEDDAIRARYEKLWGRKIPPKNGWHLTEMFEAMEHGQHDRRVRAGREPGAERGRRDALPQAARGPRIPARAGHLPDRHGRDGRRGAARQRQLLRGRGHGHQQRAPRAARAQVARAAGQRARRHRDPVRALAAPGLRAEPALAARGLGRAAPALADAPRHELRAARGTRRHPVALPRRVASRLALPARPAVGEPGARPEGAASTRPRTCRRWTSSTGTSRCA